MPPDLSKTIVVWVQDRDTYVCDHPNVVLRIKTSTKFGENLRGFPDGRGALSELSWPAVVDLKPTRIEINHSRNPFREILNVFEDAKNAEQISSFLSRLRVLSLYSTDVKVADVLAVLRHATLLAAFAYSNFHLEQEQWAPLVECLNALQLRALDMGGGRGAVDGLLAKLDVELLRFGGQPGVRVSEIKNSVYSFPTVRCLCLSELLYEGDHDAEELLDLLPDRFPRLSCLIFDWSIVDPALTLDDRMRSVVESLCGIFLKLDAFAVLAYTPCVETKHAAGEMARTLAESGAHEVRLLRFATKGLSNGEPNFSFLVGGKDARIRAILEAVFVEARNSNPDVAQLLPLIDPVSTLDRPALTIDFGGFDGAQIRRDWESKDWNSLQLDGLAEGS